MHSNISSNILSSHEDDAQGDVEEALRESREQLKQLTLETMKPEIAPWVKDYTPEMKDINIDLTITKQRKRQRTTVKYNKLFTDEESKVLVKAILDTGNALLSKKITHDWAKCILLSLILFLWFFLI